MRIAMISEHASPLAVLGGEDAGGQNTHVAELSAALAAAGHDVRVYTRRDAVDLPVTVRSPDGYDVVHVPAGPAEPVAKDALLPHMRAFGRWLVDRWRAGDWTPEVIHAHFWMSGLAALAAGRQTGVPVVQTYHALGAVKRRHQGVQDTSPPRRIGHERELGRAVDRVVAQCQDEVGELVRLGVPRSRITVVPSGVNLGTFTPLGPAAARGPGRRILTVGRLVERKGFQDVIRAMPLVPDAECVVVGGPPEGLLETDPHARRLRALAQSCGVDDRVTLVGAVPREEMGRWYRSADVLVAAPWYEPFGLTPLEAMACGVPVVGTAVGGLTDTVLDGVTGDLVPARDPRALGAAIRRLLDDRIRRFSYAGAARDRARRSYSWAATAERLADVYGQVAAVRRPTWVVA
ncbi:glycosyltransferase [Micromonospora sp. NBC_01655]|uniref:glycosyltransferase n=1 Tax=Micromonospora sp. NBC_01655 TaxID=2975983 RepID=UPI002255450E|nr:glycosyltransferase [Micromonospora sp. NBC_01655]MCX4473285.1 glycosyltransferase [Micromonospora sp. NBC_01655]